MMHSPQDSLKVSSSASVLQSLSEMSSPARLEERFFDARPLTDDPSRQAVPSARVRSYSAQELQVGRSLGSGGCAKVYSVTINGVPFAWKEFAKKDLSQAVISNEIWTQNAVSHPNILPVVGVTQDAQGAVTGLLMPLAEGGDLMGLLAKSKDVPIRVSLAIMKTLLDVVVALHEQHIVHRDLKLENVLVEDAELAKKDLGQLTDEELEKLTKSLRVADFDIGGLANEDGQYVTTHRPHGGTPGHKAPELVTQLRMASFQSDIYALGVLWHGLLTGNTLPYPDRWYDHNARVVNEHVAAGRLPECRHYTRFSQQESAALRDKLITQALYPMWAMNPANRPSAVELTGVLRAKL